MFKNHSVEKAFISHLFRYVGVGLISGSIVHMGTLGGGYTRYAILISLGVVIFTIGTLLEKREAVSSLTAFLSVSVIMSIGVGMVSGGTQHYIDGPIYAAFLIPLGVIIGYCAFLVRDHRKEVTIKRLASILIFSGFLFGGLYYAGHKIPTTEDHHGHQDTEVEAKVVDHHNNE